MVLSNVLYWSACFFGMSYWGVQGLIYANCINMAVRASGSMYVGKLSPMILISCLHNKIFVGLVSLGLLANLVLKELLH